MNILILLPIHQYQDLDIFITTNNITTIILLEEEYFFSIQHEFKHIFLLETFRNYYKLLGDTLKPRAIKIRYKKSIDAACQLRHKAIYMFNPLNYNIINKYKIYNIEYINILPNYLLSYDDLIPFYHKYTNNKLITIKTFINFFTDKKYPNEIHEDVKIMDKEIYVSQLTYKLNNTKHNYKYTHRYKLNYSYVPLSHKDALDFLNYFIKYKLQNYYRDYLLINNNTTINNHSCFSALLNVGLLTPHQIILSIKDPVFIRQLYIREYYNYIYLFYYTRIISENYWNLNLNWNAKLHYNLYNGNTGIPIFDNEFTKAINLGGYSHHIVRLKVFLAYLLMIRLNPKLIVQWFKENISIDAYDNFMYSIIYGISQSNEYPKFVNKIYLTTDNYFINISNYKDIQSPRYTTIVNTTELKNIYTFLFYTFIHDHKDILTKTTYKRYIKFINKEHIKSYKEYMTHIMY